MNDGICYLKIGGSESHLRYGACPLGPGRMDVISIVEA